MANGVLSVRVSLPIGTKSMLCCKVRIHCLFLLLSPSSSHLTSTHALNDVGCTEVTKASFKAIAGEVTVAHTTGTIEEFSVTSFYEVGLEMGLIDEKSDMVYYSD